MCFAAIHQTMGALNLVKDQTLEMCRETVSIDCHALHSVRIQTYEMCLSAVQERGDIIDFVQEKYQTREIIMATIQQSPVAIMKIPNPIFEICIDSIKMHMRSETDVKKNIIFPYLRDDFQNLILEIFKDYESMKPK